MAPITILADSRGIYLENYIPDSILRFVDIRFYSGLTLNELGSNIHRWGFLRHTRKVYIMLGINDCTVLDHASHTVRLTTPYVSGLFARLKGRIQDIEIALKREFPTVRIVFCPLYGLDIGRYNKAHSTYRYQETLNQAVPMINAYISRVNERNRVRTPFYCNAIHRYRPKKKTYVHLYERLVDGLHPGDQALKIIADYMLRCLNEDL